MSDDNEKVEYLVDEAFHALDSCDVERALVIGNQLKKLRHSSAFEVLALAHAADERLDDAIAILEEGVTIIPSVWILWQLLGNYYSDSGRYDESLRAYRRALACPSVDASSVHLNASIALGRDGKYVEALFELKHIATPELRARSIAQEMFLLNGAQRFAECVALGAQSLSGFLSDAHTEQLAAVHAELAAADKPKGVYEARGGYIFFPWERS